MTEQVDIWKDRRVNIGYETAEELAHKFNEANWRGHPESQADSLDDSLEALHWIGSVKVNIQTNRIFDGHLRVKRALVKSPTMPIPVDYYDLTPDEELLALQIHDAITEQAEPIPDKLAALLERTRAMTADRPGLGAMLQALKLRAGMNGQVIDPMAEWQGMPEFEHEDQTADAAFTIRVFLKDADDLAAFGRLLGKDLTGNKFVWFSKQPQGTTYEVVE